MRLFLILITVVGISTFASAEDQSKSFEGSSAGERKELVPDIAFHWCPSGEFVMGNAGPIPGQFNPQPAKVKFSHGFWLSETELTRGQWEANYVTTPWQAGVSPWKWHEYIENGENHPATYISHVTAVRFCERLTVEERKTHRLPDGWKYSLPTDAQWEYACRAGSTTRYSFGDSESNLDEYCWFRENSRGSERNHVHQVGMKKSNPWGFKDMHGNVFEWCSDWHRHELSGGQDPSGPQTGSNRVLRGGSWKYSAEYCQSAIRFQNIPDLRAQDIGFRLAVVRE